MSKLKEAQDGIRTKMLDEQTFTQILDQSMTTFQNNKKHE